MWLFQCHSDERLIEAQFIEVRFNMMQIPDTPFDLPWDLPHIWCPSILEWDGNKIGFQILYMPLHAKVKIHKPSQEISKHPWPVSSQARRSDGHFDVGRILAQSDLGILNQVSEHSNFRTCHQGEPCFRWRCGKRKANGQGAIIDISCGPQKNAWHIFSDLQEAQDLFASIDDQEGIDKAEKTLQQIQEILGGPARRPKDWPRVSSGRLVVVSEHRFRWLRWLRDQWPPRRLRVLQWSRNPRSAGRRCSWGRIFAGWHIGRCLYLYHIGLSEFLPRHRYTKQIQTMLGRELPFLMIIQYSTDWISLMYRVWQFVGFEDS